MLLNKKNSSIMLRYIDNLKNTQTKTFRLADRFICDFQSNKVTADEQRVLDRFLKFLNIKALEKIPNIYFKSEAKVQTLKQKSNDS